jgi:hypothetical protein
MPIFTWDRDEIEARILQRADMVGSTFVTSAELTSVADVAFTEFYLKFVSQFEDMCVVMTPATISLTSSTTLASVPVDFLKMKGIKIQDEYFLVPLSNVMETESFRMGGRRGKPTHYWLAGNGDASFSDRPAKLMPCPLPDGNYTLDCYYVPNLTLDSAESDSAAWASMGLGYGCDEYVVLTGAMKLKDKEESDCSVIMAERKMLWESIEKFLTPIDESMPKMVTQFQNLRAGFIRDPFLGGDEDFG